MPRRFLKVFFDEGSVKFAERLPRRIYRSFVRPLLPVVEIIKYGDLDGPYERRWGDLMFPACSDGLTHVRHYEDTLVRCLRQYVNAGDHVVVIGGGLGITAVVSAIATGSNGTVACYEGARQRVGHIRKTLARNRVLDRVKVHHAIVGPEIAVSGSVDGAARLAPQDLPGCDVLEMDCEGAELEIIDSLRIRPRVVLVETHGMLGAPSATVRRKLAQLGYRVTDEGPAEPSVTQVCEENDVRVIAGMRDHEDVPPN